ncbi:putative DNA ligase [Sphingomonas changbaiensis NBRC 104936]|uniref:DNA ligase (ATP) n=1 Tax=Sphingomonas changbaiensis NBRC 104936 TaxID=1219043 RepID=A0A0E9MTR0_9SPHN|nr:DNA ligase D [Sphingomonas changbaiensis]GAO40510.1 putative DNA ligase [Sphingomonas changbaiensis NBRC 104936]
MAAARTDPLARYNAKRDFTKTAEPAGTVAKAAGHSFMVQKHDATRLHWDLRLEVDGVLKSWAVTRGPSLDPEDKRLAVRTEDHPLSYATFEGTIPKGEYGGGTVMLWDRGTWAPVKGKSAKDLEKGHLHFILDGERMKGEWLLIRLKPRPKERTENWLLRKIDDDYAGGSGDLVDRCLTSVSTGRTMDEIAAGKDPPRDGEGDHAKRGGGGPGQKQRKAGPPPPRRVAARSPSPSRGGLPKFESPQLATLVDTVPAGSTWLHEAKYDGYRVLLAVGGGKAKVFTRSGLDWTDKFAVIAEAAAKLDVGAALIDGEVVALDQAGKPNFSALQDALTRGSRDLTMFAFDLLSLDGEDLKRLPNLERKELLRTIIPAEEPILFAEHVIGEGEKLFQAMCREGFEGIVSKRADAAYLGKRTQNWLKIKCIQRQEFVIVGWTPSEARGRGFRALLLGLNEDGKLRYAGKVGTGFNAQLIEELSAKLDKLKTDKPTVEAPRAAVRGARWVKPELVAEIAFTEFTADNVVRHGSFIALREDKKPADVAPERPIEPPAAPELSIKISNPERVIYPDSGITKGQLATYYAQVAGIMLPWLANRPISLVRCPQGRAKKCFFQKHDSGSFGGHVHHVPVKEKNGSTEDYLYVDSAEGLLACVQMGTIELHGWGSLVPDIEKPDRVVFDLDPDEGLGFEQVKKAAFDLKRYLGDLGLVTFPMLTGGKGVHVVAPLRPKAEWPAVKDFTHRFALALEQSEPERFVANMSKAKRVGRIFVDYLRNQRGATAILPYAARARPHAPVAAPVSWEELKDLDTAGRFTVLDGEELVARANSRALHGWGVADQVLPDF